MHVAGSNENKIKMQFFLQPQVSYNKVSNCKTVFLSEPLSEADHPPALEWSRDADKVWDLSGLAAATSGSSCCWQTKPSQTGPEPYPSCPACLLLWLWPWPALSPGLCNPLHTAPSLSSSVYTAERAQARET